MNLSKLLDNKWFIKLINYGAIALYIDFNIVSITSLQFTGNSILLWKITGNGEHHFIDFTAIILSFFVLCIVFYKSKDTRKVYALIAFFTNYFILAYHELLWFGFYAISRTLSHTYYNPQWIIQGNSFIAYVIAFITFIAFARYKKWKLPIRSMIILLVYYVFWLSIGFPVTIDYIQGHTIFYPSLYVNIVEIMSWLVAIFTIVGEQIQYITAMVKKNRLDAQPLLTTTPLEHTGAG